MTVNLIPFNDERPSIEATTTALYYSESQGYLEVLPDVLISDADENCVTDVITAAQVMVVTFTNDSASENLTVSSKLKVLTS